MIRCSHCGKLAPAGALSCQNCGMPLASGSRANTGPTEQQELPAWLESLRAHERPQSSGQGERQPFSMDELVDENSMPHWMRRNQPGVNDSGNSDAFPALPTGEQPAVSQQGPTPAASGLTAGSLIDEQSLPSWMRNAPEEAQPINGQGFSAHNLVDQQSLPPWIKELGQSGSMPVAPARPAEYGLPPQAPVTPPNISRVAPVPQTPPVQGYTPDQGFSAHDLIDQREPPQWMQTTQGSGPLSGPVPTQAGFSAHDLIDQRELPQWMQTAQGFGPLGGPVPTQTGFSAHDLIDQRELPRWMQTAQGSGPLSGPVPMQAGFSAGEFIDQRELPQWMQEQSAQEQTGPIPARGMPVNGSGQVMDMGQTRNEGMPAATFIDMDSLPSWMREGEQGRGPGMAGPGSMAAGSLIDHTSLPQWMRNAENEQAGMMSSGSAAGHMRGDGMRVPGRPRTEVSPQEQSEAAASVFSSMLGVAASAPVIPGQVPASNLGVIQGQAAPPQPQIPAQQIPPGWQSPAPSPLERGAQAQIWQTPGPVSSAGMVPPQAYPPGGPAGMPPQINRAEQLPYTGYPPTERAGSALAPGIGSTSSGRALASDTKKKSFFDAIREFFFK